MNKLTKFEKKVEQQVFGERLINRNSTKKLISYLTFKYLKLQELLEQLFLMLMVY